MDTSQQYIVMCEEAQEIQQRPMTGPDMFYAQKWMNRTKETDYRDFNSSQSYYHDIEVELSEEKKALWKDKDRYMQKVIWLPRQDQLQQLYNKPIKQTLLDFINTISGNSLPDLIAIEKEKPFPSLEILWLAFIMKMIYKKRWNTLENRWEFIDQFMRNAITQSTNSN